MAQRTHNGRAAGNQVASTRVAMSTSTSFVK